LAACPLMHLFMHGGHGHGPGHRHDSQGKPEDSPAKGGHSGHESQGGRS
jgi:hypothetical protein